MSNWNGGGGGCTLWNVVTLNSSQHGSKVFLFDLRPYVSILLGYDRFVTVLNQVRHFEDVSVTYEALRHEDLFGEWRYSSTHS